MEVGNRVKTPDGNGIIKSMRNKSIEVLINSNSTWYNSDRLDLIYDPIRKMCDGKIDTALQFITGIDAHRLSVEFSFNPYVLASCTKIKIFPHQINEVIWGLDNPRIMIADEVGLGKTIIAALIVSEIRARGMAKRLLFVVPKSLQIKWKHELEDRFDIPTSILNAEFMNSCHDPFGDEFSYVASIDYLKQDHVISKITEKFDAVIVDEAHKMKLKTSRLKLGKHLSSKTDVLIFLTATPHDGRTEDFMERIKLLNPFIPDIAAASHLWSRTIKEDVIDLDGKSIFPARTSHTIDIPLLNKERNVMKLLDMYFDHLNTNATPQQQNMIRFLSHIYRKRASSSFNSLKISLERRIRKLDDQSLQINQDMQFLDSDDDGDFDDRDFEDKDIDYGFSVSNIKDEEVLIQQILDELNKLDCDSKLDKLVNSINAIKTDKHDAKLVVFTEYRDTLEYLAESLDYKIDKIDGSMQIFEREAALKNFRDPHGCEILLCTDAAGEGIDMQFCNIEINYDLPWNPNKLEQRMGRIHRIGQDQNVSYYNFVVDSESSIDGYLMSKLLEKIEQIKKDMGDTVYDVIGSLVKSDDFENYYEKLRSIPRDQWEPTMTEFTDQIEITKRDIESKRKTLLEGYRLDPTKLDTIKNIRKNAIVIDEVKRFLQTFVELNGGTMNLTDEQKGVYQIQLSQRQALQLDIDTISGVFDADIAQKESYDYLALGNSNINKILNHAISDHVASLSHESQEGVLGIYKITIHDGDLKQRDSKIIALFERLDGIIHQVDERSVWTYDDSDKKINIDFLASANKRMDSEILDMVQKQKHIVDNRLKDVKEKVLNACTAFCAKEIQSIENRIDELNQQSSSPTIEKIINGKHNDIKMLQHKVDAERQKIKKRFQTSSECVLIGIAQITADDGAALNIRIDEAGMKAVLEHEKQRALDTSSLECIEDCSKKNCGYDIVSFDRKIEVKSHKASGSIMLTDHELKTAERLQDEYWLYIVEDVFDKPRITTVMNPAEQYRDKIQEIPTTKFRWIIHNWK